MCRNEITTVWLVDKTIANAYRKVKSDLSINWFDFCGPEIQLDQMETFHQVSW